MALYDPRAVERDNQNSLRKYPFSDAASCTNGRATLVPGAIVDAQLYVPGRTPGRVWLSSIGTDGKLRFSDAKGVFAETALPAAPLSAVSVTFTGDGGPLPGGVIVFGAASDVSALRALGGQAFTVSETELVPSAVTWMCLPGLAGFKLDDGHVVYGAVKLRGENGCDVATYVLGGTCYLRISAIGKTVESVTSTEFITGVDAHSDNTTFVVKNDDLSDHVIDLLLTGVQTLQADGINADQESVCAVVKRTRGTLPSPSATVEPTCEDAVCGATPTAHTITFFDAPPATNQLTLLDGAKLGTIAQAYFPASTPEGMRFAGYYDVQQQTPQLPGTLYYRYDGVGLGRFTAGANVTLYAHWMPEESTASVSFTNYGTLHLAAANTADYSNPLQISGCERPIPTVTEVADDVLVNGGAEALADLILHPSVPSGEVTLGLRGFTKVYSL